MHWVSFITNRALRTYRSLALDVSQIFALMRRFDITDHVYSSPSAGPWTAASLVFWYS